MGEMTPFLRFWLRSREVLALHSVLDHFTAALSLPRPGETEQSKLQDKRYFGPGPTPAVAVVAAAAACSHK